MGAGSIALCLVMGSAASLIWSTWRSCDGGARTSRLPGALMGAVLVVVVGSMLGRPGFLLAVVWLVTGLVTLSRTGERMLARMLLRHRPAPGRLRGARSGGGIRRRRRQGAKENPRRGEPAAVGGGA